MKLHAELTKYKGLPTEAVDVSVAFHDVDAMEVVWHGNYIKYFEIARSAVLRAIDYDYPSMKESGFYWPIVDMRSRFLLPATYGDSLQVIAIIVEWELRLVIKYLVINSVTSRVTTRGQTTQVPFNLNTKSMELGCPDLLQRKIQTWQKNV
ncbi:acyl-CoA thioesterase [Pseudomonadota bacterium]